MVRIIGLLFAFVFFTSASHASNFKAQGYYYKAKSEYESSRYASAISYAKKSIDTLGGTNEELQYLIILSYVAKKDWINAEKELEIYSQVDNGTGSIGKGFDESVERLTDNEKRSLAKMMVTILESSEKVKNYKDSPQRKIDENRNEISRIFNEIIDKEVRVLNKDGSLSSIIKTTDLGNSRYKLTEYHYYADGTKERDKIQVFNINDLKKVEFWERHKLWLNWYEISMEFNKPLEKEISSCCPDAPPESVGGVYLRGSKENLMSKVEKINNKLIQIRQLSKE